MRRSKATKKRYMIALIGVAIFGLFFWLKEKSFEDGSPQENSVSSETVVKNNDNTLPAQIVESKFRKNFKSSGDPSLAANNTSLANEDGQMSKEDSAENSPVIEYLKTQDYSSMSPAEINELLGLLTLGEGNEFQNSKANHVTSLASFEKAYPTKLAFLDRLQGLYQSDFINSVPRSDDSGYTVELRFSKNRLSASIVQNSQVYYQHTFTDLKSRVMTGKSPDLPPNLFIELPAKPQFGYIHPIYLEVMIGRDLQSFIAVMYNTNQSVNKADYVHAENLIFSKID